MFGDIFPASFWPLAMAHGLALLTPGPDFMLILSRSARHGWRGGAGICFGIALGNALYIGIAILGWMGLGESAALRRPLELAGAAYLAWLGLCLLRSGPTHEATRPEEIPPSSLPIQVGMGLGSAIFNPKNMIFYLTIMTVLIENDATLMQRTAAGIWMIAAVLLWDLFLAAAISRGRIRTALWTYIPVVEKICGAFLAVVAVSLLAGPWL